MIVNKVHRDYGRGYTVHDRIAADVRSVRYFDFRYIISEPHTAIRPFHLGGSQHRPGSRVPREDPLLLLRPNEEKVRKNKEPTSFRPDTRAIKMAALLTGRRIS